MQSFSEERFPVDIAYGIKGGPQYQTEIITCKNGYEQRMMEWQYARCCYNAAFGVRNKQQLEELISFFRSKQGRAVGFRFKDWTDFQASKQHIGIGDGICKKFQLVKYYNSYKRVITKPVENTVELFLDRKLVQEDLQINYKTGHIIFTHALLKNQVITANFEFDVPVRFDTDYLATSIENYGYYSCTDIPLIEVKIV